jgi:hypothetical protein
MHRFPVDERHQAIDFGPDIADVDYACGHPTFSGIRPQKFSVCRKFCAHTTGDSDGLLSIETVDGSARTRTACHPARNIIHSVSHFINLFMAVALTSLCNSNSTSLHQAVDRLAHMKYIITNLHCAGVVNGGRANLNLP